MPDPGQSAEGVMRRRAKTFYLATLFLPAHVRDDVRRIYAFCRTVDDLVDEPPPGWSRDQIQGTLGRWEQSLESRCQVDPAMVPIVAVIEAYRLPVEYFRMLFQGVRLDLARAPIETRDDLRRYSALVAGSVGMIMASMLGAEGDEAFSAARDLGVAMQLTNILRDVAEDLDRGRLYLPQGRLPASAVASLHERRMTEPARAMMEEIASEARELYESGLAGVWHLDPAARFAIFLAACLYAAILDKLERRQYDVFRGRATLGAFEKWHLTIPLYLEHRSEKRRELRGINGAIGAAFTPPWREEDGLP